MLKALGLLRKDGAEGESAKPQHRRRTSDAAAAAAAAAAASSPRRGNSRSSDVDAYFRDAPLLREKSNASSSSSAYHRAAEAFSGASSDASRDDASDGTVDWDSNSIRARPAQTDFAPVKRKKTLAKELHEMSSKVGKDPYSTIRLAQTEELGRGMDLVIEAADGLLDGRIGLGLRNVFFTDSVRALFVSTVAPDSPAERAGLMRGDRVVGINGKPVKTGMDALRVAKFIKKEMETAIRRGANTVTVTITRPEQALLLEIYLHPDLLGNTGAMFDDRKVTSVMPKSIAHVSGLEQGMRILQVDGVPVKELPHNAVEHCVRSAAGSRVTLLAVRAVAFDSLTNPL